MERNDKNPSEEIDSYWILAFNEKDNYKVPRGNSGKWLVFEHVSEIDLTWVKIKEATQNGLLGGSSKVSTAKPNPNAFDINYKVICIYTADFTDIKDVKRIEANIRSIGISNKLIYKLDKDVGKYQVKGDKNLSQKLSYPLSYYEILNSLSETKYIKFQGLNQQGKKEFRFQKLDLDYEKFKKKKLFLKKIGFFIEDKQIIDEEVFYFSE